MRLFLRQIDEVLNLGKGFYSPKPSLFWELSGDSGICIRDIIELYIDSNKFLCELQDELADELEHQPEEELDEEIEEEPGLDRLKTTISHNHSYLGEVPQHKNTQNLGSSGQEYTVLPCCTQMCGLRPLPCLANMIHANQILASHSMLEKLLEKESALHPIFASLGSFGRTPLVELLGNVLHNYNPVGRSELSALPINVWLQELKSCGVDLLEYARTELDLHKRGAMSWKFPGIIKDPDGIGNDVVWTLKAFRYSQTPSEWAFYVEVSSYSSSDGSDSLYGLWEPQEGKWSMTFYRRPLALQFLKARWSGPSLEKISSESSNASIKTAATVIEVPFKGRFGMKEDSFQSKATVSDNGPITLSSVASPPLFCATRIGWNLRISLKNIWRPRLAKGARRIEWICVSEAFPLCPVQKPVLPPGKVLNARLSLTLLPMTYCV